MAKKPGSGGRGKHHGHSNYVRKNERIRSYELRVIGPEGNQLGILKRDDALQLAKEVGLDLVEISPGVRPPVCRIMDFGKFQYEQSKKNKDKTHSTSKLKEVKFRVRIEQHDYETKLRRAEDFLFKGNKVKLSLMFRGREMEHRELGFAVLKRAVQDLVHISTADSEPRMAGRNVSLTISALPVNKRKLKYNDDGKPQDSAPESR